MRTAFAIAVAVLISAAPSGGQGSADGVTEISTGDVVPALRVGDTEIRLIGVEAKRRICILSLVEGGRRTGKICRKGDAVGETGFVVYEIGLRRVTLVQGTRKTVLTLDGKEARPEPPAPAAGVLR